MATDRKKFVIKLAALVILSLFFLPGLYAENIPAGDDVAAQGERVKKEAEQKEKELEFQEPQKPSIEIQEEKPSAGPSVSFILKDIKISGMTIFKQEDMAPVYREYLDKTVTLADLENISKKIKSKYSEKGYLSVIVYIPEQEIKYGIALIQVLEGVTGKIEIEGNKWFSTQLLKKYFQNIKKNEPMNIRILQKDIRRINENPDIKAKIVISKSEQPGAADLVVKVKDSFPWHIGATEDNNGSRLTGRGRTAIFVRSTNATGNGDSIFSNTLFTRSSSGEFFSYKIPVGMEGTKLGVDLSYFTMALGKEFKDLNIHGTTMACTPYLIKELYLSELAQLNANFGIDMKSVKKKTSGAVTSSDQLRTPYVSLDLTENDEYGQTGFIPRINIGTAGFLGASHENHVTSSRPGTGGFFAKYEQDITRTQRMPWNSYVSVRSQYQATSHTLSSSEQFQLGGVNSVRGYPEGDYMADTAVTLNLDWAFQKRVFPLFQVEPVVFADAGVGKLKKVLPGELHDKFLAGAGAGLRFRFADNATLRLDWAEHLGDKPVSGSGPSTFHFTFQVEI